MRAVRESNERMKSFFNRLEFATGGKFDAEKAWSQSEAEFTGDGSVR
ncbi:hypothetical protein JXA84_06495 [candidate division WOR-3 bacterium]|nr:hypothetical protein [candidate division WOR-3 bacterium]